jgi:O-antigen/teichoic acid export membrane protein
MTAGPRPGDARKVAVGVGLNVLGTIGRSLLVGFYVMAGRGYGGDAFGLYALAYAPIDLMAQLVSAGAVEVVLRYAAREPEQRDDHLAHAVVMRAFIGALLFGLFFAVALALIAWPLAVHVWDRPEAPGLVMLLALNVPILSMVAVLLAACRAVLDMKGDAIVRGAVAPLVLVSLTAAFMIFPGLRTAWGLVVALTVSNLVSLLAALIYVRRHYLLRTLWQARRGKLPAGVRKFAVAQSVQQMLWNGLWSADLLVLAPLVSDLQLGLYRMGCEIAGTMISVRYLFSDVYSPMVARDARAGALGHLGAGLTRIARWVTMLAAPTAAVIYLAHEPILAAVNPLYPAAAGFLAILLLGPLVNAITGLSGNALVMTGHVGWALAAVAAAFAVNVGSDLVLAPRLGLVGAAWGTVAGFVVMAIVQQLGLARTLRAWLDPRPLLVPVLASAAALAVAMAVGHALELEGLGAVLASVVVCVTVNAALLLGLAPEARAWLTGRASKA